MAPTICASCQTERAVIVRPKNHHKLCRKCFISVFEAEIHDTIVRYGLFQRGERIAIGASGGKDSTVLASVLQTLNDRHDYGLELVLLSVDEGIKGYRDDSLQTVKRNAVQYGLPLEIIGYDELYGWTMDQVVEQIGKKGNCTYCGVFRRQALDRGASRLGIKHVVTGHNADDVAETVIMNLLRGDLPRLARATSIVTQSFASPNKRSKPLKYAYEKEIVLYAHHKKLDYFSTECIYSPEAFRGTARTLIKNMERIRPSAILDVVRSGEDMAKLVPVELRGGGVGGGHGQGGATAVVVNEVEEEDDDDAVAATGGCGSANGRTSGGEMIEMERRLRNQDLHADTEIEITSASIKDAVRREAGIKNSSNETASNGQGHKRDILLDSTGSNATDGKGHMRISSAIDGVVDGDAEEVAMAPNGKVTMTRERRTGETVLQTKAMKQQRQQQQQKAVITTTNRKKGSGDNKGRKGPPQIGQCSRCGYLSSQSICQACMLVEGLNKNRPRMQVVLTVDEEVSHGDGAGDG